MAKKKLTDQRKVERILAGLLNTASDIASSKKTAEVLAVIQKDIALFIAIAQSEVDDDLEIARKWLEVEHSLIQDRAAYHGYIQASLLDQQEANGDDKQTSENPTKKSRK